MLSRVHRFRTYVIIVVMFTAFGCLVGKLFSVQVLQHRFFLDEARRLHTQTIVINPCRGRILDREGRILAMSQKSKIACLNPIVINDPERTKDKQWLIRRLAEILSLDIEVVRARAEKKSKNDEWREGVWLKRKLSHDEIQQLEKLISDSENFLPAHVKKRSSSYRYRGVYFQQRAKRVYPNPRLLCHVLGFMQNEEKPGLGLVRDDSYPAKGIEKVANHWLKGKYGYIVREKDNKGRGISVGKIDETPVKNGFDVQLTIDRNIQYIAEEEIRQAYRDYPCSAISIVVIRARTGEILALANMPDYDPNDLSEFFPEQRINYALEQVYEPGSIMKAITGCIALDQGLVKLDDTIFCENGYWRSPTRTRIRDSHPHGDLKFLEVISKSSNIGICKAIEPLGKKKLYECLLKFGFKSRTDCGLDGEVAGILDPPKKWWVKLYQVPFGQGISVTSIQMTTAFSVIVNNGLLVQPYIIKRVLDRNGRVVYEAETRIKGRVVSTRAAEMIRRALTEVTTPEGTAPKADIPEYTEGGKTGTAQVADPAGGYSDTYFNSSFVGYAPAGKPEIIVLVTLLNTRRPYHYGGKAAAPVFRKVSYQTLKYLMIVPDERDIKLAEKR